MFQSYGHLQGEMKTQYEMIKMYIDLHIKFL
jgi:hypothetical protein